MRKVTKNISQNCHWLSRMSLPESPLKVKGKAFPLQTWTGPVELQEAETPRISRQSPHEGG